MIKVSIVIPVHNVERYLRQCLDSVVNQTLRDIEIICVDDGSTDGSAAILQEYSAKDSRVKVLQREHTNAGAARNAGMAVATGEWLFFFDADDFAGAEMLSRMTTADDADHADIVVAGHRTLEDGQYSVARLPRRLLRSHAVEGASWPSHLFIDASVVAWNKLFRRAFVARHNLSFQEIDRHNDMWFVCCALSAVDRIAVSDTCGYVYRRGRRDSVTKKQSSPFLFVDVLLSLRTELERRGIFQKSVNAYCNLALAHCCYHLLGEFTAKHFSSMFSGLRNWVFEKLGLKGADETVFVNRKHYQYMLAILCDETPLSLLMLLLRERYVDWRELGLRANRIESLQKELAGLKGRQEVLERKVSETEKVSTELNRNLAEAKSREEELVRQTETRQTQIVHKERQLEEKGAQLLKLRQQLSGSLAKLHAALDANAEISCQLKTVRASKSYRIGRVLTWPFRFFSPSSFRISAKEGNGLVEGREEMPSDTVCQTVNPGRKAVLSEGLKSLGQSAANADLTHGKKWI